MNIPDPGQYTNQFNSIAANKSLKAGFGERTINLQDSAYSSKKHNLPGPGTY